MNALQQSIESLLKGLDIQKIKGATARLTSNYRSCASLCTEEELHAYLISRLPATYAALCSVLKKYLYPGSILDLGAGPGTVWWVVQSMWKDLCQITAIERESKFIELGQKLGSKPLWIHRDMLSFPQFTPHDWVICGYSLGEIAEENLPTLLDKIWQAAQHGVVIVEPGTPKGYQRVLCARDQFIQKGGFVRAPCPHSATCPLPSSDWCHFSVRLERSFLHKSAKQGTLPYEDEKYSFVIVTKEKADCASRIIRPPMHRSGHSILPLCTLTGLQSTTISKRHKEYYKKARKSNWGDEW